MGTLLNEHSIQMHGGGVCCEDFRLFGTGFAGYYCSENCLLSLGNWCGGYSIFSYTCGWFFTYLLKIKMGDTREVAAELNDSTDCWKKFIENVRYL